MCVQTDTCMQNIIQMEHNNIYIMHMYSTEADIFINFESLFTFVEEDMILVEVCAVTSSTPPAGQTVSATFTTQDGTAIGTYMHFVKFHSWI